MHGRNGRKYRYKNCARIAVGVKNAALVDVTNHGAFCLGSGRVDRQKRN